MCGRYNLIDDPYTRLLMALLGIEIGNQSDFKSQYNIAPTEFAPIITSQDGNVELTQARWWLVPSWAKEPSTQFKMFNARSETIESSKAYKKPFAQKRCIAPASGWYEWKNEGGKKVPYYVHANEQSMAMAGVYDVWEKGESPLVSYSVLTTAAPESMQFLHDRMPLLLNEDQYQTWLQSDADISEVKAILKPQIPYPLEIDQASREMNNARNKSGTFIEEEGEHVDVLPLH